MNFGVIGYGYWGPNIVRNLTSLEGSKVLAIAEISPAARKRAQKAYPGIQVTADASDVISSTEIDAIAVVTPVWTHYELAKAALENGKHVFVEKPFTSNAAQGEELINLAQQKESQDHGGPHLPVHRRGEENQPAARRRKLWESSTTTIPRASTWGFSSTTSTCFGTLRRTIFPSWTT